eukprot:m.13502 g.13502  ORF g.13502 m.13502 type:complete len:64 (+) comp7526_c0_seq1:2366-2557(+)
MVYIAHHMPMSTKRILHNDNITLHLLLKSKEKKPTLKTFLQNTTCYAFEKGVDIVNLICVCNS